MLTVIDIHEELAGTDVLLGLAILNEALVRHMNGGLPVEAMVESTAAQDSEAAHE